MKKILLFLTLTVFISCDDIVEVPDISNQTITVLAPTDESTLTINDVNFSWNNVEDAENYRLQIATPSFENATQIVLDTTIAVTSYTKLLEAGIYEWRVRAENTEYQTNYSTQNFIIEED